MVPSFFQQKIVVFSFDFFIERLLGWNKLRGKCEKNNAVYRTQKYLFGEDKIETFSKRNSQEDSFKFIWR